MPDAYDDYLFWRHQTVSDVRFVITRNVEFKIGLADPAVPWKTGANGLMTVKNRTDGTTREVQYVYDDTELSATADTLTLLVNNTTGEVRELPVRLDASGNMIIYDVDGDGNKNGSTLNAADWTIAAYNNVLLYETDKEGDLVDESGNKLPEGGEPVPMDRTKWEPVPYTFTGHRVDGRTLAWTSQNDEYYLYNDIQYDPEMLEKFGMDNSWIEHDTLFLPSEEKDAWQYNEHPWFAATVLNNADAWIRPSTPTSSRPRAI